MPDLRAHKGLVAFYAGAKLELSSGNELPTRLNVAPWKSHDTGKGKVIVNETTSRELPGNQKRSNFDRIPLDFNHNTVPDSDSYRGEPAKIAGMATPVVVAGEGIIFEDIDWTPEGRDAVSNGHYVDLSPTVQLNARGEVVFIHSAAVCRVGAIPDLTLFSADPLHSKKSKFMDYKALLSAILGVGENASDEDITKSAQSFAGKISALPSSEQLTALSAKVGTLETAAAEGERGGIIAAATREGKVIPQTALEGDTKLDNKGLKALCASLPVTVPLEQRTPNVVAFAASAAVTTNSADEEVRKSMGISEEKWKTLNA